MRRFLISIFVCLFLFGCSSDQTGVVDPNAEQQDAGEVDADDDGDAGEIDAGDPDVGEPHVHELCEDEPSTSFCDGERIVECSDDGTLSQVQTCVGECVDGDDGAQCECSDEYDCAADQLCIDGICAPNPCLGDGERYCDGDQSISCGDEAPIDCEGGCDDGLCLCDEDVPCPEGYECVDQGNSAGMCRVIDCEAGELWCESNTLVACDEDGDGATEVEVCEGACVDHGDSDAFCGCASAEHCGDEQYCDSQGTCHDWECEPNSEVCDDANNAVVVCSGEGTIEFVEDCGSLSCEAGVCECDGDDQCADDEYCGTQNICLPQACTPGERSCSDELVLLCDERGSAFETLRSCPDDTVCTDGACACSDDDQCADGESCTDDACFCESDILCSSGGECCDVGEECVGHEICDEGICTTHEACLPECPGGQRCGESGELCCTGDTPVCDPRNVCVPDCSGEGPLCGEDLDFCCDAGDQCLFDNCQTPGASCDDFLDCDFGEYCEQELGHCLADDFPDDLVCEEDYDFAGIEPEVLWQWDGVDVDGTMYSNVMMTPLAADMDGSGTPNVIANAYQETGGGGGNSVPVVIDGATGETVYYNATRFTNFGAQLAVADVTGNGLPEIVGVDHQTGGIGLIENIVDCPDPEDDDDGCYLWWNDEDVETDQGAPVVADLNADGNVEIILRETILNGETGEMIAQLDSGGYDYTVAVDVNGDGRLEILGAGCLYSLDEDHELSEVWCTDQPVADDDRKRYVAAGDVTDEDGRAGMPEFVITGDGNVYVVAADDGTVLHQFPIYGDGAGGSPIIADFDGDGSAEFGIASANCYTVFDLDCVVPDAEDDDDLMEDRPGCERPQIETCDVGHHCACEDLQDTMGTGDGVLWSIYVQDESSHRTGSSVFDFQGNGRNEVVYNDECLLMVLDGQDGSPYFLHGNTNRTSSEYPIVVDVTGNGQTNIVVSANNDQFERDCQDPINDQPERFPECHPGDADDAPDWCTEGTHGVIALQDPNDRWVRTRSVWNQFDYYIDNATDDTAGVPTSPSMPWESHNTFRANRQGEIPLNSPNPTVHSLSVNSVFCPEQLVLSFVVENAGTRAIGADLPISIYRTDVDPDELIETVTTTDPIFPGQVVPFEISFNIEGDDLGSDMDFRVVANDDGQGGSPEDDCDPDAATAVLDDVPCGIK